MVPACNAIMLVWQARRGGVLAPVIAGLLLALLGVMALAGVLSLLAAAPVALALLVLADATRTSGARALRGWIARHRIARAALRMMARDSARRARRGSWLSARAAHRVAPLARAAAEAIRALLRRRLHAAHLCAAAHTLPAPIAARAARL